MYIAASCCNPHFGTFPVYFYFPDFHGFGAVNNLILNQSSTKKVRDIIAGWWCHPL